MHGTCEPVASVDSATLRSLFSLFERHYADVTFELFERDFREKDLVILLRDDGGELKGFSTLRTFVRTVQGRRIRLLFSGDTIIDEDSWGEQELGRVWSAVAGELSVEEPHLPLYWLLLSKGYRTYLYLPLFFRTFYPRFDEPTPEFEAALIAEVASHRYGSAFDHERGVVAFATPHGRLRADLASVPAHRRDQEHVRFFLERNAAYASGQELVCLARLEDDNMRGYARRNFMMAARASARPVAVGS